MTSATAPAPSEASALRARLLVLGAIGTVVALSAGAVFDERRPELAIAPVAVTVVAVVASRDRAWRRVAASITVAFGSVAAVVMIAGGSAGDTREALFAGVGRLRSTEWPSPLRPDLLGAVAGGLAVVTAVAAELTRNRRWHLLPLLPHGVAYAAVIALSAPTGPRLWWLLPLGVLSAVFAVLHPAALLGGGLELLRGQRRLLTPLLVVGAVAAGVATSVSLGDRADPRSIDPAERTEPLLDPVEATVGLRRLDPPVDLHVVTSADTTPLPARWRTAALDDYDGQRWSPDLTLRPIGRRLGPDGDHSVTTVVTFLDDDVDLVPLPGDPITIDAPVETDLDRTLVRLLEPRATVTVTSDVPPTAAGDQGGIGDAGQVGTRAIDDTVSDLSDLAETLAGDGTVLDRLRRLERVMREEFALDPDVPGGGLQRALIDRFLRDTQRGNAEQFTTAYVLLARSLGVDARVATGYVLSEPSSSVATLRSADARIWPEVRIGESWTAFDPLPTEVASDLTPPPPQPRTQTPAAAQPPVAPPPEPGAEDQPVEQDATERSDTLSVVRSWALRLGLATTVVAIPLMVAASIVVLVKRARRRRWLTTSSPLEQIRGAWAVANDRLVDAGHIVPPSATDDEIARAAAPLVAAAPMELHRLAWLSAAATFGAPTDPRRCVHEARHCLQRVESALAGERTRWQRLRWRLSLRSLRRATRSPVSDAMRPRRRDAGS